MAMLAERKSKQKWSCDPRNTTWTNDTSRFGYQMLTKMGWKSGRGLGAKEDGTTTNIKSGKRRENLGLGADKSNEDNWLSHQMAFDDLLSQLNSTKGHDLEGPPKRNKKHEMEKMARQSRKRVFYNRFIQSKDLSSKSEEDMACIFGQRSKSDPGTPQEQSEGEETDDSAASCPPQVFHGVQTINSGQSIQEYFEKKMKELKAAKEDKKKNGEPKNESTHVNSNEARESVEPEKCQEKEEVKQSESRKSKKKKRKLSQEKVDFNNSDNGGDVIEQCVLKKKKRKGQMKSGEDLMHAAPVFDTRETKGTKGNTKRKREKNCSDTESRKIQETKSKKKVHERDEEKSCDELLYRSMKSSCNSEEIRRKKKKKTRKEKISFRIDCDSKVKPLNEGSDKHVVCNGYPGFTEATKRYREKKKGRKK